MNKIYSILGMLIVTFSMSSLAAAPGEWIPSTKIKNLFVEGSDESPVAVLTLNAAHDEYKPEACQSAYITFSLVSEKGKSLYSAVLAAKLAEKNVSFTMQSCSGNRPIASRIRI